MAEKQVQTLERSLDILEVLAAADSSLGVTEIGNRINLHKSTVHRIIGTLCYRGYVEKERESDRYHLGFKIMELGIRCVNDLEVRTVAEPFLVDLVNLFDETVHLVLFDKGQIIYIDKKESSQLAGMRSQVGRRAPMHCTSVGKAILAHMPKEEVLKIIKEHGLPKFTQKTITTPEGLFKELEIVKKSKIGRDDEENEMGIICLGTPIFHYSGRVIGGVSISGPSIRMLEKGLDKISEALKDAGIQISKRIGYRPI